MLKKKASLTLRLTGCPNNSVLYFSSYASDRKNLLKKYQSIANLQMTAITNFQIFSETIFRVIKFYGNACNAYREGRNEF